MAHQQENHCFRSTIKPELLNLSLKRGSGLALIGILILMIGGTALPLVWLKIVGIPLFLMGFGCIALGMRPYRQLSRLQLKPHTLTYDGNSFLFAKQGKPLFSFEESSLSKVVYLEKEKMYGWGIWLKRPLEKKIKVFQTDFDFEGYRIDNQERFEGCDLFLPFFSERSLQSLIIQINGTHCVDEEDSEI